MKNVLISLVISNQNEKKELTNIYGIINNNKLTFKDKNDKYKFDLSNLILEKENNESILKIHFKKSKYTYSKYFIKTYNRYFDIKVLTNEIYNYNNNIKLNYEMWITDEYTGKFKFELKIKEEK